MQRSILINIAFLCFAGIIIFALVFASSAFFAGSPTPVAEVPVQTPAPVTTPTTPAPVTTPTKPVTKPVTTPKPSPSPVPAPAPSGFTAAQVAAHKFKTDCWSIVSGNVYNLTKWISLHPGGSGTIVGMCGVDATSSFTAQHGGQRKPESELASFKIGPVIN